MRQLGQLLAFMMGGLAVAWLLDVDVDGLAHSGAYRYGAYLLLAIGLYGATCGIALEHVRRDVGTIALAVTIGVVCKALLIGGVLALLWRDPLFLILGVAVAQIDPLSVASIMADERMSVRARNVLASWSSFDDPITVVLSIYAASVGVTAFGIGDAEPSGGSDPLLGYAVDLAGNLVFAVLAWLLWRWVRRAAAWLQYLVLAAFVAVSVAFGWMLAIAVIGLFARPERLQSELSRIARWAMYAAASALGLLLIDNVNLREVQQGAVLGVVAFGAQVLVAIPLTRGMPRLDRWHLAAAQQNGITAIILALTLQVRFDGAVAIIAPAIIAANLLHLLVNTLIDRNLDRITAATPG